jgi:creatinine amidohydrolase
MVATGYWQDLTTRDFDALDPETTVALLPLAAVEQHGPHLPLATDALINEGILRATLPRLVSGPTLLVLPALSLGHSPEHIAFPGTLTSSAEALLSLWTDAGRSVARAGVRKLILFNSHGGQRALVDLAALRLRVEVGILAVRCNYSDFGTPRGLFDDDELALGIHGGAVETSLVLHLRPDLVRRDAVADFNGLPQHMAGEGRLLGPERTVGFGWMSQDLHPAGVCGDATRADAQAGRRLIDHLAERLGALVREVAALPLAPPGERSLLRDRS